jgi:hypothetical protein
MDTPWITQWYSCTFCLELVMGGKNRRTLLAENVTKQLQEIRLNEDLLLKI